MKRYRVLAADPSWPFDDRLTMSETKRGAESNYAVLTIAEIAALRVERLMEKDAVLVLWRPSSLAEEGARVSRAWGFRPVGEWVWSKRPAPPTEAEVLAILQREMEKRGRLEDAAKAVAARIGKLHFGMGRVTRAAKEVATIAVRGSMSKHLVDRAVRDVVEAPALRHSVKTELVQDALERMYPEGNRLELFARRKREGWTCVGNQVPGMEGRDIRAVLAELATIPA